MSKAKLENEVDKTMINETDAVKEKRLSIVAKMKQKREQKKIEEFKNKTELEKVEERREEVLSKGRKFKYPMQYAKYRVVTVTIILSVMAVVLASGAGYFMLYKWQSTNPILYRLTQLLPVSVANVNGADVRYSDYLLIYRSTITPIEKQQGKLDNAKDNDFMEQHYKRLALDEAENYAWALKLAKENDLTVTDKEVDETILEHRKIGGVERSEEGFKKILEDNFGLTMKEYRRMIYLSLVKEKVSQAIDTNAVQLAAQVESLIKSGKDLKAISEELGDKVLYEETGGLVDKMNVDGGRSLKAMSLNAGEISDKFVSSSGDGYYFVKLVAKTDSTVNYTSIKISFTEFDRQMKEIRDSGKVKELIKIDRQES